MQIDPQHITMAAVAVPLLAYCGYRHWMIAKRPGQMSAMMTELGVDMHRVSDTAAWTCMQRTKLSKTGKDQRIENAFRCDQQSWGLNLFDFRYTVPNRHNGPSIFRQTVAGVDCGSLLLPQFRMRPEGLLQKAQTLIGIQDIDFAEHPAFSQQYFLQSDHEAEVRHAFHQELLDLFTVNPGWWFESRRGGLICYKPNKLLKANEMKHALLLCSQVYDLLSTVGPTSETEDYFQDLLARNRSHVDSIGNMPVG